MNDRQCVDFLQWALPKLQMRWAGFRKVRSQVCKRVGRRIGELGLGGIDDYCRYLRQQPAEWHRLDALCRITISRFGRDKVMYEALSQEVLPVLADRAGNRDDTTLGVWSAGCASGEEPYTLAILWHVETAPRCPGTTIEILATDADPVMLRRASEARYQFGTLKELPEDWRGQAFRKVDGDYCLRPEFREAVTFLEQDIRHGMPEARFDLVLCRNLAFTYFAEALQRRILGGICGRLRAGGALVIGAHETLPDGGSNFSNWLPAEGIFRKRPAVSA